MRAGIVVIGDEILSGHTQDTNTQALARRLAALGVELVEARTVPDDATAISVAVSQLHDHRDCELVVTTGGLGPTHDDLTVTVVSRMHGTSLVFDEHTWERFQVRAKAAHEAGRRESPEVDASARKMALVPKGAEVFDNDAGAAPGLALPWHAGGWTVVLPGVPQEMARLWEDHVEGFVQRLVGDSAKVRTVREHVITGFESRVAARIEAVAKAHHEVDIGSYPQWGQGKLVLRVSGLDAAAVDRAFAALVAAVDGGDDQEGL